jgi:hypothetical protein
MTLVQLGQHVDSDTVRETADIGVHALFVE